MASVPQRNSKPEIAVRRLVYSMGYRYRIHRRDLPGTPDLTFVGKRKVIFVHGCFWHRHGCKLSTTPKANTRYWSRKFKENQERDRRVERQLACDGWSVLTVWQCQVQDPDRLASRILSFLEDGGENANRNSGSESHEGQ
jgi:DNA mismatch endonuclease (patch repair protein)